MVFTTWPKLSKVEAIVETESIREAINEFDSVKERVMLASFGIKDDGSGSDCDVYDKLETDDTFLCQISSETRDRVITALRASQCNWFALIEALESVIEESDEVKITSQKLFSELTRTATFSLLVKNNSLNNPRKLLNQQRLL